MSDTFEHNPGAHEDPLSGPTWMVGFIGAVLLAVIMLGLTALYYNFNHIEENRKVVERDPLELEHLREPQLAKLAGGPRWVQERVQVEGHTDEQVVQALVIPIDQAMNAVAAQYGSK